MKRGCFFKRHGKGDHDIWYSPLTDINFTVDGKNYCHIINPDTLFPSDFTASVTVICEDSALADALSTALFNMPVDEGAALVETLDGIEALWQTNEHEIIQSSGFEPYRE